MTTDISSNFPTALLLILEQEIERPRWVVKVFPGDELEKCLQSTIELINDGHTAELDKSCKRFLEVYIPNAFKKIQCDDAVDTWPETIQNHVYEILKLFIDLVAIRLSYSPPVPIQLLETLSIIFDCNNEFQTKHRLKPYDYEEFEDKLDDETILTFQPLTEENSYGWLRSLINRFVFNSGIKNLIKQFNNHSLTTE
ncbi:unnamed protein product, partial [Didymodactylos carnosus]